MKYPVLSLLVASVFAVTACSQETASNPTPAPATASAPSKASLSERIKNKGTITVATEGNYAPFTFHDKDSNALTGYDVEVVRAVAAKLGVTVEFKEMPWVGIFPGLEKNQFDMIANQVALTSPERQAQFDKSEPYSWSARSIITRSNDNRITKFEHMSGLYAAQISSSSYGKLVTESGASLRPVESAYQAVNLVKLKEVDFTLNDSLVAAYFVKQDTEGKIKIAWTAPAADRKSAGLIIAKGNDEALQAINAAILELKADGTLKKLGEQFFGQDVSSQEY